ncbi:MAG: tetratricopeptide repeat protein [Chloroflexota bacterium]|nr:tetratricopeptide repeat protein [Chloroflexota bacterium]
MRRAALWLVAFASCVGAFSAVLTAARTEVTDIPAAIERLLDPRTDGERAIAQAQAKLANAPDDPKAAAGLAAAYLGRVRETYDPSLYAKAASLIDAAVAKAPNDPDVAVTAANLALSRHDFAAALRLAQVAQAAAPARPAVYGVLTDAYVELGRYDEAIASAQRMVDLRPDLASYSRVSYLRELHGDLDGAIDAMRRAVDSGAPRAEGTAWSEVQLGNLYLAKNDLRAASRAYDEALQRVDGYVFAVAGQARVLASGGDLSGAAALYERIGQRLPVPDFFIALADLHERLGDVSRATQDVTLVHAMEQLLKANGVRTDIDLALFDADHDLRLDDALATARAEYAIRPSVTVAMTLAWTEYKTGDLAAASRYANEALRLGWRDPVAVHRAAVIAGAAGDVALAQRVSELQAR